jgi:hypothetical protein
LGFIGRTKDCCEFARPGGVGVLEESTTPDLLELYQRGADAFNAGDLDIMGVYAPHAVIEMVEIFGTWEGRAAIRAFFEDWLGAFDGVRLEIRRYVPSAPAWSSA